MVDLNRSVGEDIEKRARLIKMDKREGDAELHRRQGNPLLQDVVGCIECSDLAAAAAVRRCALELGDKWCDDAFLDLLAIGCDVTPRAVEIAHTDIERIQLKGLGNGIHHLLGKEHALGSAETAEGSRRYGVRLEAA